MRKVEERVIVVDIDEEARITADTQGFSGDTCLGELERLLRDVGYDVAVIERKEDAPVQRMRNERKLTLGRKKP